jgi:hypothetical protein
MMFPGFFLNTPGVVELGWPYSETNLTNRTEVRAAVSVATAEYVCLGSGYAPIALCTAPAKNVMGLCDDGFFPAPKAPVSCIIHISLYATL